MPRGLVCIAVVGFAAAVQSEELPAPIEFDIPPQRLGSALAAYSAASGLQVFYDSDLASGRFSTVVQGRLRPDVALRVLLEGTHLSPIYEKDAFALVPADDVAPTTQAEGTFSNYFAVIQRYLEQELCRHPETVPGVYRLAATFRIRPDGHIAEPELLGSTGNEARDGAIGKLLRGLSIGEAPPTDLPQPVTVLVRPLAPRQTGDCDEAKRVAPP